MMVKEVRRSPDVWCFALSVAVAAGPLLAEETGKPAVNELVNPLAVPAVAKWLELPQTPPAVQQASYWRRAQGSLASGLVEPPGAAVFVGDQDNASSSPGQVELATASESVGSPRAAALLVVARELAVDAKSPGDLGDVLAQCHRALDASPDKTTALALAQLAAWACNRRGELRAEEGDERAAFDDFQEAILLDPECWQAIHNRGVTLARYGKHTEALADFDRVIALAPEFAIARQNRGEVLGQLDRWRDAVADFTTAIDESPGDATLLAARGHAWRRLGRTKRAASDYNQALRLDPQLADAYAGRGSLFAEQALYEQALDDFREALRLDPEMGPAYQAVAWLISTCPLAAYRHPEKGLEAARRARQLLGDTPELLDTLAAAHANAGEFREAIRFVQQAIVLADAAERPAYEQRLALYRAGRAYRTGGAP